MNFLFDFEPFKFNKAGFLIFQGLNFQPFIRSKALVHALSLIQLEGALTNSILQLNH